MFQLLSLCSALLCVIFGQEFKGQVDKVYLNIDMVNTLLLLGFDTPAVFIPGFETNSTVATPTGSLTASAIPGVRLESIHEFHFEEGKELHFQIRGSYRSEGIPGGPSGDPSAGFFLFGPVWAHCVAVWLLTDTTEFALIQTWTGLFAIPIGKRQQDEVATYTIIVDRSSRKIRFNKDNINLLIAPGTCGIDNRFSLTSPGKIAETCPPFFEGTIFDVPARLLIFMGNVFSVNGLSPFCNGCIFDQCNDSLSHAFGCQCQHPISPPIPGNATYHAQLDAIQVIEMQRTQRCHDEESSSSTFRQWWRRPVMKDDNASILD